MKIHANREMQRYIAQLLEEVLKELDFCEEDTRDIMEATERAIAKGNGKEVAGGFRSWFKEKK